MSGSDTKRSIKERILSAAVAGDDLKRAILKGTDSEAKPPKQKHIESTQQLRSSMCLKRMLLSLNFTLHEVCPYCCDFAVVVLYIYIFVIEILFDKIQLALHTKACIL
jgi:hypothetical protein